MSILQNIKNIMPEKIPSFAAIFYTKGPARMFQPHYVMVADEVSLPEGAVMVDIGTGPGILPIDIAKKFPRSKIIGVDLSEKMIEIANKNKKAHQAENVEFKVMDANDLRFADNSIDFIISTGSLHHWKNPKAILNEIHRCLKPGGSAWVYDGYGQATNADIDKAIRRFCCGFPWAPVVRRILSIHGYTQKEYDTIIKDIVANSRFKTCSFDKRGIMMRVTLRK